MTLPLRSLFIPVGILGSAYLVYVLLVMLRQSQMIFVGQGTPMPIDLRHQFPRATHVTLRHDGGSVFACYLEAENESDNGPVAIVAHGNAETIGHWGSIARHLHRAGLSVFLVEYPGYGGSDGRPSQASISKTFESAYAWLETHRRLSQRKVIGLGRSLGTGPVAELTYRRRIDGLVLLSPFSSLGRMAAGMGIPAFLLKTRYDNVAALRQFEGPTLILHGQRDRVIPAHHADRLAKTSDRVTLHRLETGHNDFWNAADEVVAHLRTWLEANRLWPGGPTPD